MVRPPVAVNYVYGLFTPECWGVFFEQWDVFNAGCLKLLLSRGISIAIVVLSSILKVPQILNILPNRSNHGLAISMFVLEVIG